MEKPDEKLLADMIQEQYKLNEKAAAYHADKLLRQLPEIFWENLREWSAGRPLTEIRCDQYSIPMIMHIRQNQDFLDACYAMVEYCQDKENGERLIWRTVR